MKKFYLFFTFFILLFTIKVNAVYNANTSYNITLPDFNTFLYNSNCGSENAHSLVQSLINESSSLDSYITIIPNINNNSLTLYASKKSTTNVNRYYYYLNTGGGQFFGLMSNTNGYNNISSLSIDFNSCSSFTNSTAYNTWYNWAKNSISYSNEIQETGFTLTSLTSNKLTASSSDLSSISNDNSYTINNAYYPYYSSRTMNFKANSDETKNYAYYYFKKICLTDNNTCYSYLDNLVSYYDIYGAGSPPEPETTTIGYSTSLKSIYTNLLSSNVSNYSLKLNFKVPQSLLGFYQTPQEYVDNTQFNYICSGRVNNSNYYTYDSFNCSLSNTYTLTDNSVSYTFNNFTTNQNLSNYDRIYITIQSNYLDSNISTTIFNYNYTYNLGSAFITDYKGAIYENFTSLPLNFKMYLSSNNTYNDSLLYVKKNSFINYNIKYIGFSNTTYKQNLVIGNSILGKASNIYNDNSVNEEDFIEAIVSNSSDTGIMIYQDNSGIPLPELNLFFNSGIVLSINNSTNDFYYIDSTGTITNGTFVKPIVPNSDKYDISYYLNKVNDFINDLSNDTNELSLLTQEFYNGLPLIFQTFILIVFILACTYFLFILIRK